MSYQNIYELFVELLPTAKLSPEFPDAWLKRLQAALPTGGEILAVPEFGFFAMFAQRYAECDGDPLKLGIFMARIGADVAWIKQRPGGKGLVRRLSQASLDGPLSSLLEICAARRIDSSGEARLRDLDPVLSDGRKLDSRCETLSGEEFFVECFASLGTELVLSGKLDGYWHPSTDAAIPKIRGKIWDKADQARSAGSPVALVIAPSLDFMIPHEKIPHAVNSAFSDQARVAPISAVVFTRGSHPFLCESVYEVYANPAPAHPLPAAAVAMFKGIG